MTLKDVLALDFVRSYSLVVVHGRSPKELALGTPSDLDLEPYLGLEVRCFSWYADNVLYVGLVI